MNSLSNQKELLQDLTHLRHLRYQPVRPHLQRQIRYQKTMRVQQIQTKSFPNQQFDC